MVVVTIILNTCTHIQGLVMTSTPLRCSPRLTVYMHCELTSIVSLLSYSVHYLINQLHHLADP